MRAHGRGGRHSRGVDASPSCSSWCIVVTAPTSWRNPRRWFTVLLGRGRTDREPPPPSRLSIFSGVRPQRSSCSPRYPSSYAALITPELLHVSHRGLQWKLLFFFFLVNAFMSYPLGMRQPVHEYFILCIQKKNPLKWDILQKHTIKTNPEAM